MDAFNAFAQFAPLLQKSSASAAGPPPPPSRVETENWLDVLKYDEPPKFDVLAKTIEYAKCKDFDQIMTNYAVYLRLSWACCWPDHSGGCAKNIGGE